MRKIRNNLHIHIVHKSITCNVTLNQNNYVYEVDSILYSENHKKIVDIDFGFSGCVDLTQKR